MLHERPVSNILGGKMPQFKVGRSCAAQCPKIIFGKNILSQNVTIIQSSMNPIEQ